MRSQFIPSESSSKAKEKRNSRHTKAEASKSHTQTPQNPQQDNSECCSNKGKTYSVIPINHNLAKKGKNTHDNLQMKNFKSIISKFLCRYLHLSSCAAGMAVQHSCAHKTLFHCFLLHGELQLGETSSFLCCCQKSSPVPAILTGGRTGKCFKALLATTRLVKPQTLQ